MGNTFFLTRTQLAISLAHRLYLLKKEKSISKTRTYYPTVCKLALVMSFQLAAVSLFHSYFISHRNSEKISENVHVGGGILIASSLISNLNLGVGVGYGSLTLGSHENNVTLNVGWGATKGDSYDALSNTSKTSWSFANKPMFTFSGMTRISRRCMLVSENWFFAVNEYTYDAQMNANGVKSNYNGVLSGGVRIMLEKVPSTSVFYPPWASAPPPWEFHTSIM